MTLLLAWLLDGGGGSVTAAAVIGLGVLLLAWALRGVPTAAGTGGHFTLSARERAGRLVFVRQRDPDRAGRPRPRAPSPGPAPA
ncbi:DUF6412 domain-containing protein [Streptosporangium sp. NPDC001559]|uniref:DUF6412 domain-containing protein n=1 Tax=Streptosporangium sp. NPDC001559 TaxID=3366187 RepID=UPI0036EADF65